MVLKESLRTRTRINITGLTYLVTADNAAAGNPDTIVRLLYYQTSPLAYF